MEMGGVEKVMLSLLNNLNPEKFDFTVLLNLNQGELRDEFPPHVRKVYLTAGKEDFSRIKLLQKILLLKRKRKLEKFAKNPAIIDREILKDSYDVEIGMTYNDFEPVLNSTNRNSKKIGWFHSEINVPKLQPLVPKILEQFPQFDYMIYCSQRIMDLMHQEHPKLQFPQEQVIINAIPVEEIKAKAEMRISDFPKGDVPVFISVGRLHTRKGYHKLIDAHAKLLKDGFEHRIIILGDGEEKDNLERQIAENNVTETFILAGNKMNPYPYLKQSDFFIMPSESEAWPLVLAEALILQKPVIATDTGDVATMIENGKTGLIIEYDTKEMYDSMKRFLTDTHLISTIRKNLLVIEKRFDNANIFNSVEEILCNLAMEK